MWLFYADRTGYIPCGSSGQWKIDVKADWAVRRKAELFLGKRSGRVYALPDWTPEMSWLGPTGFCEYVAKHGKVVAYR